MLGLALIALSLGSVPGATAASFLTLERRVTVSADDVEESSLRGTMHLTSNDLELIHDSSDQTVGMRWTSLAIPPGSVINAAYVQFAAKESQSEATSLTLRAQAADNAPAFASAKFNISSRPLTVAGASWTPVAWTAGEVGANQRTPGLATVIQEVVSRSGWASGNALALIITGTGHRTAWAYDGRPATAPLLHVEYVPPERPPIAALTVTQAASPPLTVTADGSGSTDVDLTPIATYRFDFGDGTVVTTTAPTATAQHTYADVGTYTVTLTVTDTGNSPSTPTSKSITVNPPDSPPVASLSVTQLASPSLTVSADGSVSTDTDATPIASYRFDFGDGTAAVTTTPPTATAQHTYAAAGTYTVTLTVTDTGNNSSAPATQSITVNPPPPGESAPVASLSVTQLASPSLTVSADGSASTDTDATPIASYRFDFGDGTAAVTTTAPTATTQHTYAAAGTYTVSLTATDSGNLTSAPATAGITVSPPSSSTTVERRVAASSDDAEEFATGSVYLTSSDLELIHDSSDQTVGMRWTGLTIPAGSTIIAAYIQFAANESQTEVTNLTFRAQAADNAATFGSGTGDISTRPRTVAAASWAPVAWTAGEAGANQRTPDLAAVIQEVVSQPGWASGNALAVIVTGTGHRTAWSYNGSAAAAPLLHVEFSSGPLPENPPVARLSVTQLAAPALTVRADGSASTDVDATPIASYRFDFGDGTAAVTTTAPTATAQHTYAAAGTYTVSLTATDTGNHTSAPATASITVSATTGPPVAVYAGYYDTHHPNNLKPKPNPWQGSPNVVFVGTPDDPNSGGWDTSALRIDNLTGSSLSGVVATVDIGTHHYALWGTRTIPAGYRLLLAQTAFENFDGSDTNPAGCFSCNPNDCLTKVVSTVPVIHVTVNGTTTDYPDTGQVLNTNGADGAGCPYTGTRNDESTDWQQVYPKSSLAPQSAFAGRDEGAVWMSAPYPNLVRGPLTIRFRTHQRGEVRLALYDLSGRLVRPSVDGILEAGEYTDRLNLTGMAPGIYYCRLSTLDGELHRAIILVR